MITYSSLTIEIGMPVYNGEKFIRRALTSLLSQSHTDWALVIADNGSTDNTHQIIQEFAAIDSRINVIRHERNIGALANFLFLANRCNTPFFMWAAADDEWSANYISSNISILYSDQSIGFASGQLKNIDTAGEVVRSYASFFPFSHEKLERRLVNFMIAREADGKANIIYSVFRTDLLRTVSAIPDVFKGWGADMAFVAAALARARYSQASDAVLFKRVTSDDDRRTSLLLSDCKYQNVQFQGNFPPSSFASYVAALYRGMPTPKLRFLVLRTMLLRYLSLFVRRSF